MSVFLDCLCDQNYKSLIINGNPSAQVIDQQWILLLSEYVELRNQGAGEIWKLTREIHRLRNHLTIVDACVEFLRLRYSDEIAKALRTLGYQFNPTSKIPEDYSDLLNIIVQRSKTKFVKLQQLLIEYSDKLKDVKSKDAITRSDFDELLIDIEQMQNSQYNFEQMSVSKFVMLEKKLLKRIEKLNSNHVH